MADRNFILPNPKPTNYYNITNSEPLPVILGKQNANRKLYIKLD